GGRDDHAATSLLLGFDAALAAERRVARGVVRRLVRHARDAARVGRRDLDGALAVPSVVGQAAELRAARKGGEAGGVEAAGIDRRQIVALAGDFGVAAEVGLGRLVH